MEASTKAREYSGTLGFFARVISFLTHPLLIGVYLMAYLVFSHPSYFAGYSSRDRLLRFFTFANNNFILPTLVVFLLRGLGFSKSIYLKTQKERIVPYIACSIFFFWTYYVFANLPQIPEVAIDLALGMFLTVSLALILNNFFKISMHAMAAGGAIGLMINIIFHGEAYSALPLIITLIGTALICSARKIASDHSWFEIITGLITGMLMQGIAAWL